VPKYFKKQSSMFKFHPFSRFHSHIHRVSFPFAKIPKKFADINRESKSQHGVQAMGMAVSRIRGKNQAESGEEIGNSDM
jgi:hypothetical protein